MNPPEHDGTLVAGLLLAMPRLAKRGMAVLVDTSLCVLAVWIALYLRLEVWLRLEPPYFWAVVGSVLIAIPLFVRFGLYRAIFRYAGWNATLTLGQAMALYSLVYATVFTMISVPGIPRSVGIIQPLLLFMFVALSRLLVRVWLGGLYRNLLARRGLPGVLIYGAGNAGRQLAAALVRSPDHRLLGFIDDDPALQGNSLDGRTVYAPQRLPELVKSIGASDVLLALPSASQQRRRAILDSLRGLPLHVRTLPAVADLASGKADLSDLRELDIEDLLGREPVAPSPSLLKILIRDRVVAVTGAGGSIGSELCRQIAALHPRTLLLIDQSEYALYAIHQELQRRLGHDAVEIVPLLASVQDEARMAQILGAWNPHTLYHAAAYKHVPLVEHNAVQGLRNNVWGTWVTARTALAAGVRHFVLISTDKAVRPTNIMGASKRLAELVLQALAERHGNRTRFSMVRFGNVLGSSGSVVPLFREQIAAGGPVTVTHPDITRFFMTIPEAAQLVIQAGAMAEGGDVFVLDMGEPVRIMDLAVRMIELSGLQVKRTGQPWGQIEIQVTGLRPGEKLYEELLIGNDPQATSHPRIWRAREARIEHDTLMDLLARFDQTLLANDVPGLRALLQRTVQGYQPTGGVVDWLHSTPEPPDTAATRPAAA